MGDRDLLGPVEVAVLDAVNRGSLRSRCTARQVPTLRGSPRGEALLHEALRRCERDGLVRSDRDNGGRRYEMTAAGRARLRAQHRFRAALIGVLQRGRSDLTLDEQPTSAR